MRKPGFFIIYTLLVLVQILLCNSLNLLQYMVLSLLPALIQHKVRSLARGTQKRQLYAPFLQKNYGYFDY